MRYSIARPCSDVEKQAFLNLHIGLDLQSSDTSYFVDDGDDLILVDETNSIRAIAATRLLAASDRVVARVTEAVAQGKTTFTADDVVTFMAWRTELRSIAGGTTVAELPVQPPYPENT